MMILARTRRGQRGQSMAEFVIVVPVLTLMFYAVLYFGQAVVYKGRVAMAARYLTLKTARGFGSGNIHDHFFSDVGPANSSKSTDTYPWINIGGMFTTAAAFAYHDQLLEGLVLPLNPNVWELSTTGEVSYRYDPPGYLSFIGQKKHKAGLMVDGNPWAWPTMDLPWGITMELFLAAYALDNDLTPWWLPMPWMMGFPRWWALTPWFFLPPYPQSDV
ncbi:pilus assembly protein [bacterium]|nr:pilus assembly protein [candidate division CSSED10-310 bacterium]